MNNFQNFTSTTSFKLLVIVAVIIVLLIPQSMIKNLISERSKTHDETVNEIHDAWGDRQVVQNTYISIPYKSSQENILKGHINVMPDSIDMHASADVSERYFGLYKTPVYLTDVHFKTVFDIEKAEYEISPYEYLAIDEAELVVVVSNQKGVKDISNISINSVTCPMEVIPLENQNELRLRAPLNSKCKQLIEFNAQFKGSEQMQFCAFGKSTMLSFSGNWNAPSFTGNFLPDDRDINSDGFIANWRLPEFNYKYNAVYVDEAPPHLDSAFGVEFINPVDIYLQTERSVKYAFLIIILTFLVVLFSEIRLKLNLNPFIYLLIGLAIVMFYSLELSLTEHIAFSWSYLISVIMTVMILAAYTYRILHSFNFSLFIMIMLFLGYSFIYIILQMETYSLLVGSLGVFSILAIIMFVTSSNTMRNMLVKPQTNNAI